MVFLLFNRIDVDEFIDHVNLKMLETLEIKALTPRAFKAIQRMSRLKKLIIDECRSDNDLILLTRLLNKIANL